MVTACAGATDTEAVGNDVLGIARFDLDEKADRTTLTGFDAKGAEIARLELQHGRFALSPSFAEDYGASEIDGRKLTVNVNGQKLNWETGGYDPVLELPSHPTSQGDLATFLDDPHAKAVLDKWQIGFEPFQGVIGDALETAFTTGAIRGDSRVQCNNQSSCGSTVRGLSVNTCGGGAAAMEAARVTQRSGTNCGLYSSSYSQHHVAQCCPAGSGGQSQPWFARKTCTLATAGDCDPDGTGALGTADGTMTSCGCQKNSVACKGCPEYPYNAQWYCGIYADPDAGSCSGTTVNTTGYTHFTSGSEWCAQYPGYKWCERKQMCIPTYQSCFGGGTQ